MNFLGYPSKVPDARTIWLFKERLAREKGKKEKEIWDELQRQLDRYGVRVKQGKMKDAVFVELGGWRMEGQHGPVVEVAPHTGYAQDSTIIDADPGAPTEEELKRLREIEEEKRRQKERKVEPERPHDDGALPPAIIMTTTRPKPRGDRAKTTRSRDGTWTKKRGKSFFGYKLHTKDELASGFITEIEVTTASANDGTVDLSRKGEVCVRDRGYPQGGRGSCISMI